MSDFKESRTIWDANLKTALQWIANEHDEKKEPNESLYSVQIQSRMDPSIGIGDWEPFTFPDNIPALVWDGWKSIPRPNASTHTVEISSAYHRAVFLHYLVTLQTLARGSHTARFLLIPQTALKTFWWLGMLDVLETPGQFLAVLKSKSSLSRDEQKHKPYTTFLCRGRVISPGAASGTPDTDVTNRFAIYRIPSLFIDETFDTYVRCFLRFHQMISIATLSQWKEFRPEYQFKTDKGAVCVQQIHDYWRLRPYAKLEPDDWQQERDVYIHRSKSSNKLQKSMEEIIPPHRKRYNFFDEDRQPEFARALKHSNVDWAESMARLETGAENDCFYYVVSTLLRRVMNVRPDLTASEAMLFCRYDLLTLATPALKYMMLRPNEVETTLRNVANKGEVLYLNLVVRHPAVLAHGMCFFVYNGGKEVSWIPSPRMASRETLCMGIMNNQVHFNAVIQKRALGEAKDPYLLEFAWPIAEWLRFHASEGSDPSADDWQTPWNITPQRSLDELLSLVNQRQSSSSSSSSRSSGIKSRARPYRVNMQLVDTKRDDDKKEEEDFIRSSKPQPTLLQQVQSISVDVDAWKQTDDDSDLSNALTDDELANYIYPAFLKPSIPPPPPPPLSLPDDFVDPLGIPPPPPTPPPARSRRSASRPRR